MSVLKTVTRRYLELPQLITPSAFQEIAELLDLKHGRDALQAHFKPMSKEERIKSKMADPFYSGYRFSDDGEITSSPEDYGVIKVEGPLTYKPEMNMCAPDTCNYQEMVKQVEYLASSGKKRILMIHDSPGGEAYSMMSSAKQVRKIADDNDIELIGYVDGMSASASYGWLSICDKIVASSDSQVGSVGVVISLLNNSGALEKAGYKRTFITAGASKVPFDEEGEFKSEFIEQLQDDVNELYENFVNHVANYREGMSAEDVKNTEAKVFRAKEALTLGLIDEIMDVAEFKEKYLVGESSTLSTSNNNHNDEKVKTMSNTVPTVDMAAFEAMQKELSALKAEKLATETAAKKEAITQSLSGATFLSNVDGVVGFLMNADEAQANLVNAIVADASAELAAQSEKAAAKLEEVKQELTTSIETLTAEKEQLVADHEKFKEEFATTDSIRDEEKEETLQSLDHKEKLARAVAAAKAKKQA